MHGTLVAALAGTFAAYDDDGEQRAGGARLARSIRNQDRSAGRRQARRKGSRPPPRVARQAPPRFPADRSLMPATSAAIVTCEECAHRRPGERARTGATGAELTAKNLVTVNSVLGRFCLTRYFRNGCAWVRSDSV